MRARELVRENNNSIDEVVSLISKNCQEILHAYKFGTGFLYRGIKTNESFFYKSIRQDRTPLDLDKTAQEIMHQEIQKLGIRTTRKNSIFCSGSPTIASNWGETYVVFPTDMWRASWFPGISEETYSFFSFSMLWDEANNNTDVYRKEVKQFLSENPPVETDSGKQLANYLSDQPTEVMISGIGYYAIKKSILFDTMTGYNILSKLGINL